MTRCTFIWRKCIYTSPTFPYLENIFHIALAITGNFAKANDTIDKKKKNRAKKSKRDSPGNSGGHGRKKKEKRMKSLQDWNNEIEICTAEIARLDDVISDSQDKRKNFGIRLQQATLAVAALSPGETSADTDRISLIGTLPDTLPVSSVIPASPISNYFPSGHVRKLKCLLLCPTNDARFLTSSTDGYIKLWQIRQEQRLKADRLESVDANIEGKWPEDIAWNPNGDSVVSVYDRRHSFRKSQVAVIRFDEENQLSILPSVHGELGVSRVQFMPWGDLVTAGVGREIVYWRTDREEWTAKILPQIVHKNDITGICGMTRENVVLTVGKDKQVIGYDCTDGGGICFSEKFDTPILGITGNPVDHNLFCLHTNSRGPGTQIKLFDYRSRSSTEIMTKWNRGWQFGLEQKSDTYSTLVSQTWSPCGYKIVSGCGDAVVHIFDIRRVGVPSQSFEAHTKPVYKAVFTGTSTHLVSISCDKFLGIHEFAQV